MNPRILLAIIGVLALCVGLGAWWRAGSAASRTSEVVSAGSIQMPSDEPEGELTATPTAPVESRAPATLPKPGTQAEERRIPAVRRTAQIVGHVTSKMIHKEVGQGEITAIRQGQPLPGTVLRPVTTEVDGSGRYFLPDLVSGEWSVVCVAPGYERQEKLIWVPDGPHEVMLDFVLASAAGQQSISVHLRGPAGRSLLEDVRGTNDMALAMVMRIVCVESCPPRGADLPASARVLPSRTTIVRPDPEARGSEGSVDYDEWFRVGLEQDGAGCCCLVLGDRVLDVAPFQPGATRVDLFVSPEDLRRTTGSVKLSVLDDVTGAPVVAATVRVRCSAGHWGLGQTDPSGNLVIASVMPGEAVVEVETAQYARFQQSTIIRSGAETDLGTLRLRSKVSVSGSIVYPSGISVQRPFVFAYLVDPRTDSTDPRQPITATCQDNAFRFDKLDPGNYIVGWEAPSVQPRVKSVREGSINGWRYVDARSGDAAGVRIELTEQMARDAQQQRPH